MCAAPSVSQADAVLESGRQREFLPQKLPLCLIPSPVCVYPETIRGYLVHGAVTVLIEVVMFSPHLNPSGAHGSSFIIIIPASILLLPPIPGSSRRSHGSDCGGGRQQHCKAETCRQLSCFHPITSSDGYCPLQFLLGRLFIILTVAAYAALLLEGPAAFFVEGA